MKLTVLGAGAWGTALAVAAATRGTVCLWTRDGAHAQQLEATRRNQRYLPGVALPAALTVTSDLNAACSHPAGDGLVIIATPMAGLQALLQHLQQRSQPRLQHPHEPRPGVLWLCKGFQEKSGLLGHELAAQFAPDLRVGVLSGPSFAQEVARGQPTALVAASSDRALSEQAVAALHSESLRIYTSNDPVGVEVGGAVKNVLAIATGIADGMQLGLNARAALITRGLAEMARLGLALGAQVDTFMGLSGLGDLVLTATGDLSRNRKVGLLLAQGLPLPQILQELGHVAEGVNSAAVVLQRAQSLGVDMPITQGVVAVLAREMSPAAALTRLMGRQARAES
ncbi:MAG: NAD(P)H-dependent glycerol-3-phosphate dehydrogenase [Burkholderiales bacterium]